MTIDAVIISVIFANERNGFTVVRVKIAKANEIATGIFPAIRAGERVRLNGEWTEHSKYGRQFGVQSVEVLPPQGTDGLIAYLGSGIFAGIGEKTAALLVENFGEKLPEILDTNPMSLKGAIKGLTGKRLEKFIDDWYLQGESRKILLFLYDLGFTGPRAADVWNAYKGNAKTAVQENPYLLCGEPFGWSFEVADNAAKKLKIEETARVRLSAAIIQTLQIAQYEDGHSFLPREILLQNVLKFLHIQPYSEDDDIFYHISKSLDELANLKQEISKNSLASQFRNDGPFRDDGEPAKNKHPNSSPMSLREPLSTTYEVNRGSQQVILEEDGVWIPALYEAEKFIGAFIRTAINKGATEFLHSDASIKDAAAELGISYSTEQVAAIKQAVSYKFFAITGGPGTGKTTILRGILHILREQKKKFLLAAPTGRAARRMAELCGEKAFTIHRLLEIDPTSGLFSRNKMNPLDADCIVVDESSMIDDELAADLMRAIPHRAQLILIGDADQLPSVGAGSVLREILSVEEVPSARLSRIYRQGEESDIAENAHRILAGYKPNIQNGSHFHYIQYQNSNEALKIITELDSETQILTPMHKGALGTQSLNVFLQKMLNFDSPGFEFKGTRWAVGDPVMQLKNNYEKDIFNGDLGKITRIMPLLKKIEVDFEGRTIALTDNDFNELSLAYACTVHKSQGSEYRKVAVILDYSHSIMLQRNLLYTAVTRAKDKIWVIASPGSLDTAIKNNRQKQRWTRLAKNIELI